MPDLAEDSDKGGEDMVGAVDLTKRLLRRVARKLLGRPSRGVRPPGDVPLDRMLLIRELGDRTPDWCTPVFDPLWVESTDAAYVRDEDVVVGYLSESQAWAFPWWIMKNHHVANLTLEGRPTLITFCEACAGAAAYDPVVEGTRYTLRVDGIYNGVIVLSDYETGSWWSPFTGHSLHGPAAGKRFQRLPVIQCTWAEWRANYPGSLVLPGEGEKRDGHGAMHPDPGSTVVGDTLRSTAPRRDRRLKPTDLVVGVSVDGATKAYPLAPVHRLGGVINDEISGTPIAVVAKPDSWIAVGFDRRSEGDQVMELAIDGFDVVDRSTGARYDFFGRPSDPETNSPLTFVRSGLEKWSSWSAYHPDSVLFESCGRG